MTVSAIGIGERDALTDDYLSSPSPAAFSYGGALISATNEIVLGANATVYTDPLVFTIDHTKSYLLGLWNDAGFANHSTWSTAPTRAYSSTTSSNLSLTVSYTGTASSSVVGIQSLEVAEAPATVADLRCPLNIVTVYDTGAYTDVWVFNPNAVAIDIYIQRLSKF